MLLIDISDDDRIIPWVWRSTEPDRSTTAQRGLKIKPCESIFSSVVFLLCSQLHNQLNKTAIPHSHLATIFFCRIKSKCSKEASTPAGPPETNGHTAHCRPFWKKKVTHRTVLIFSTINSCSFIPHFHTWQVLPRHIRSSTYNYSATGPIFILYIQMWIPFSR